MSSARREYGAGGLSKVRKQRSRKNAQGELETYEYDYWCASWSSTDSNGKRSWVRGYGESKGEAQRRLRENLAKRLREGGGVTPRSPRISDFLETWLDNSSGMNAASKQRNRRNIENHVVPYLNKPIANITGADLAELFNNTLPQKKVTPSSRYNAFASLRTMLNFAVQTELLEKNPCKLIQSVKKPKPKVRAADDKYVDKRLNISKFMLKWLADPRCEYHDTYPRILLMYVGLRRAELLGLEWACVQNLEKPHKCFLEIKQQLKGPETGKSWHVSPGTKTGESRVVPLPEIMRKALLTQKAKNRKAVEPWAKDLVFLTPEGKHVSYNQHSRDWNEILIAYVNKDRPSEEKRALDESEYFRPHASRRLCTNLLVEAGLPLEVVKDILGHKNLSQTEAYNSITAAQRAQAIQAVDSVFDW